MRRLYFLIIALFFLFGANAQQTDTSQTKSSQTAIIRDLPDSPKKLKFLSIVDGKQRFGRHIKKVNPKNIINVDVLKRDDAVSKYGKLGINGVVVITTKHYVIKTYQRKLSSFSLEYNNYLEQNKNDDSGLVYLINGGVVDGSRFEIIKKLFDEIEKVKTVDFIDKLSEKLNLNNPKPIVVITTKQ